jgi:hypothetical protein
MMMIKVIILKNIFLMMDFIIHINLLPIEDFELSNVESKYVYIQNLIKDIINELEKTQFIIE